jgi:hypothetical protein
MISHYHANAQNATTTFDFEQQRRLRLKNDLLELEIEERRARFQLEMEERRAQLRQKYPESFSN